MRQPAFRDGQWQLLECTRGWDGNWKHDCFVVFGWHGADDGRFVVALNFAPIQRPMPRPPSLREFVGEAMKAPLTYT